MKLTEEDKQRIEQANTYGPGAFRVAFNDGAEYEHKYQREQQAKGPYTISEDSLSSYINIFLDGKIWLGSVERGLAIEICNKLNHRLKLLELEAERSELKELLWICQDFLPQGVGDESDYYDRIRARIKNSLKK